MKSQRSSMFLSEGKDHKKEKILSGITIKKYISEKQNCTIQMDPIWQLEITMHLIL
ncbi:MAG: hypothetical protein ABIY50_12785 [Ignavibacteria bacterium]